MSMILYTYSWMHVYRHNSAQLDILYMCWTNTQLNSNDLRAPVQVLDSRYPVESRAIDEFSTPHPNKFTEFISVPHFPIIQACILIQRTSIPQQRCFGISTSYPHPCRFLIHTHYSYKHIVQCLLSRTHTSLGCSNKPDEMPGSDVFKVIRPEWWWGAILFGFLVSPQRWG
jgi:hypothetical protein